MPSSGRFGVFLRGISPPAGGEFLCPRRQRNQNAAGDGSDEHFVLIVAFPRTPFTGVTPWGGQNPSGARNQECLGAVPSGPTGGLCFEKIEAAAVPRLRLGFRTNAPGPFSAVGAHSVRPRAGLGPAPANRRERLSTRPPDFRQGFRKAAGAALAVARDGYGIRLRFPLQGRLSAARKPSPYKGADSPYQGEMSRSDRGDRDRCPRRGRMRVPSWLARPPAGGPRASPTRTRKVSVKTVGEGTTPLIKGRYRAQRDKGDRDLPLPTFQDTTGRPVFGPCERGGRLRGERGGTLL